MAYAGNPVAGFCHTTGMEMGPEYLDGPLLGLFDREAQRACRTAEDCG